MKNKALMKKMLKKKEVEITEMEHAMFVYEDDSYNIIITKKTEELDKNI